MIAEKRKVFLLFWLQFAGMTKLKKAAFLVMARCLSSEEISGLRQLFKTIDTDSSGTITVDELKVSQIASACRAVHIAMVTSSKPAGIQLPSRFVHQVELGVRSMCFDIESNLHLMS